MHNQSYVFAQLASYLNRSKFNRIVAKYQGDSYIKVFSCWNQLKVLMFGQLSRRESLRDLIVAVEAHSGKAKFLGFGDSVTRSTWQKPNAHLNGNGCPICAQSRLESDVLRMLRFQKIPFDVEKSFDWLVYKGNLFLDFFLPEYSIAIECQGEQHFHACDYYGGESAYRLTKQRDERKRRLCEEHGIKVLYYSDLGFRSSYEVIASLDILLKAIKDRGIIEDRSLWQEPSLFPEE